MLRWSFLPVLYCRRRRVAAGNFVPTAMLGAITLCFIACFAAVATAQEPVAWIRLAADGSGFETSEGRKFVPIGFNYDHDASGMLLEDYWFERWNEVVEDFHEMRQLGANVVRVHLQFGKFVREPAVPNEKNLKQLKRLLQLAEETGLYLDITGLGCYHKPDVPAWYDQMSEQERWEAQAEFWRAVAAVCADSPAVFCYDLMNEPVVPGGNKPRKDWLGPPFGDKYFVQFISLDRKGRERPDIAVAWIRHLRQAIRSVDQRHLVTVGLVPWSVPGRGLTSGFEPQRVAPELDFLCVHIYPESNKIQDALETLKAFCVGKPVVIEETFPLRCSPKQLEEFLIASEQYACGWIGFYWGKLPEEYRPPKTIADHLTLGWLEVFRRFSRRHLQLE